MLRSVKGLLGYRVLAKDGHCGKCSDLLFDDDHWTVRYLEVDTGGWISHRKVLVSPISFGDLDWDHQVVHVNLTKDEINNSPDLSVDAPVSRQYENIYFNYYGWPYYWVGPYAWGTEAYPGPLYYKDEFEKEIKVRNGEKSSVDRHLRSVREILGYRIHTNDAHFGGVEDFIVDDHSWTVRYLVVEMLKWAPSKSFLVIPSFVTSIDYLINEISLDLNKENIKSSPTYDRSKTIDRNFERELYDFYRQPIYWEDDARKAQ